MGKVIKMLLLIFILQNPIFAQEKYPPSFVLEGTFLKKTIPLRDFQKFKSSNKENQENEKKEIENELHENPKVNKNALPLLGDPIAQTMSGGIESIPLIQNFEGFNRDESGFFPPDPTGSAGPNHYVHAVNSLVKIFDKEGNLLVGPVSLGDFFGTGSNSGDPIVLYDQLADRYIISQIGDFANSSLVLGISETADPTGSYFVYEFIFSNGFPDYPKLCIWPNAYYLTINGAFFDNAFAIERNVILNGGLNPKMVSFQLPNITPEPGFIFSPLPANLLGNDYPSDLPGYIVYLQDDGWAGVTFDHLKVWEINIDWNNTNNSTISEPIEITTAPFEVTFTPLNEGDVNQPNTDQKIDIIPGVISYAANYRSFSSYNSWVITFTVDVDGYDTAGIRWIELRNDNLNDWSIFQEGTYAPADGISRFFGSSAMDKFGNIGLAFNVSGSTTNPGIRYTGRFNGDQLGQMTIAERVIVDGGDVQAFHKRFGDYSHMTMDPDGITFWNAAEYMKTLDTWGTRIAAFRFTSNLAKDVGINSITQPNNGNLTTNEIVNVSIRNYGTEPQSNFPIELRVNGNFIVSETFSGVINPGEVSNYQFNQTLDLSDPNLIYTIEASTLLIGDEFVDNNNFSKQVKHLLANDIGVIEITSPVSSPGLLNETVIARIKNFGYNPQTNFDVQYNINGGSLVNQLFTGTLEPESEALFAFDEQGDFMLLGTYTIAALTNLINDEENTNDETQVEIINSQCFPESYCRADFWYIKKFNIGTINNISECSPNGYGDYSFLSTQLQIDTTVEVTIQSKSNNQFFSVWIDYNDNLVFEPDELVISDAEIPNANQDAHAEFVLPNDLNLIGEHLLRVRSGWQVSEPTTSDPCIEFQYGETEDYTVAIVEILGISNQEFNSSNLIVVNSSEKNYEMILETNQLITDLNFSIVNIIGQKITSGKMEKNNKGYSVFLNLSQFANGVYLVKVGNGNYSKIKRFILQ